MWRHLRLRVPAVQGTPSDPRSGSTVAGRQDGAILGAEEQRDPVALADAGAFAIRLDDHEAAFGAVDDAMDLGAHVDDVDDLALQQVIAGPLHLGLGPGHRHPLGSDADVRLVASEPAGVADRLVPAGPGAGVEEG